MLTWERSKLIFSVLYCNVGVLFKNTCLYNSVYFQAMSVLSLLMAGKHRKEVQRQLAELRLIPRLSELFDTFIWKHGIAIQMLFRMSIA